MNYIKDIMLNNIINSPIIPDKIRLLFYKYMGFKLESSYAVIKPGCIFNGTNIEIGYGTFINYRSLFENAEKIVLGRYVAIGMDVLLCTANHQFGPQERRAGKTIAKEIIIEDGCWIGSKAVILPGVRIGSGCVIAAGAVVTKDCEPNGLYMGIPAVRKKDLMS